MPSGAYFYQLFDSESSTYTYLLIDPATKAAVLIDPVLEKVERDLTLVRELDAQILYVLETHVHADHITGAGEIRKLTGAKTVVGEGAGIDCADLLLRDGEVLRWGKLQLKALATPGHTNSCTSYLVGSRVFTGDTLLIRGTGRTDFQQGSAKELYQSITQKLFSLPEATLVYPAHDYKGQTHSTIREEKKFNPRIGGGKSEEEFVQIMSELKLAVPKRMHEAVPANLACGRSAVTRSI